VVLNASFLKSVPGKNYKTSKKTAYPRPFPASLPISYPRPFPASLPISYPRPLRAKKRNYKKHVDSSPNT
jgi:hypothetical protein